LAFFAFILLFSQRPKPKIQDGVRGAGGVGGAVVQHARRRAPSQGAKEGFVEDPGHHDAIVTDIITDAEANALALVPSPS
jgi:hypothetical protein